MDAGGSWFILLGMVGVAVAAAVLLRKLRVAELQRADLTEQELEAVQVALLEYVRRNSFRLGTWVPLAQFWKAEGVRRDGDRIRALAPLVDAAVLGIPATPSGVDGAVHKAIEWVSLSVPTQVVLHELAFRRMYQGEPLIIGRVEVIGDWVMGDQDKSTTYGDRAGRDLVRGDRVGRDKAGRDAHGVTAGGNVIGSGNAGSVHSGVVAITSPAQLSDALREVEAAARARGESAPVIEALQWAAGIATSGDHPEPSDQSKHQRALDRASEWVRLALSAIAEGVTGALTEHWLLGVLRG